MGTNVNINPMPEHVNDVIYDIIKENMTHSGQGVFSGFDSYDNLTHGFLNGSLTVIASRPSMGKSALIDTITLNLATKEKKTILYFSIESNERALLNRFISNLSGVSLNSMYGNLNNDEIMRVDKAAKLLSDSQLYLHFMPDADIDGVSFNPITIGESGVNYDIIIIDYIQLLTTGNNKTTNRVQEVGYIIRKLKALAKNLNIPIIVASQLNRGSVNYVKPMMQDLRNSGEIEDVADVICFIHRPDYYGVKVDEDNIPLPEGLTELIIAKNRHGDIGNIRLTFDKDTCKFSDYVDEIGAFQSHFESVDSNFVVAKSERAPF